MPGKSRRKRGKYLAQSRKSKGRLSRPAMLAQQPAVAQTGEPVPSSRPPIPSKGVTAPVLKSEAVQHPYIAGELWNIAVLTVIMVIILVVLAKVLS